VWRYWVTCDDIVSRVTIMLHWWRYWCTCDDTESRVSILFHIWRYCYTGDDTDARVTILIHAWRYIFTCDDTVTRMNSRFFPCTVRNILYMTIWSLMVAMYTTEVTFKPLCFVLTWRIYVCCMMPRTWALLFLNNVEGSVFLMDTDCVLYELRTEMLCNLQ